MDCCLESVQAICPVCGTLDEDKIRETETIITNSKLNEVPVLQELNQFKLTDNVKIDVTLLYHKAVGGKTRRNAPRRAAIYCCLIAICKEQRIIFDRDEFQNLLDLKSKDINKASKSIKRYISDINIDVTIDDIIKCIMKLYDMKEECIYEILAIHETCNKTSMLFNSSKMETLAAGLVYYYLKTKLEGFDEDKYFNKSKVSKDTIIAVFEDICQHLKIEK